MRTVQFTGLVIFYSGVVLLVGSLAALGYCIIVTATRFATGQIRDLFYQVPLALGGSLVSIILGALILANAREIVGKAR